MLNRPNIYRIKDRLTINNYLSKSQRDAFVSLVSNMDIPTNAKALSVSVGDGFWDYSLFKHHKNIKSITATDIVECPVHAEDIEMLHALEAGFLIDKMRYCGFGVGLNLPIKLFPKGSRGQNLCHCFMVTARKPSYDK